MQNTVAHGKLGRFFSIQSVVFLHFLIFAIGLFELTWAISRKIAEKQLNFNVLVNQMCDWIAVYDHGTLPQLLFFGLSLCSLLALFGFYWFVIVRIRKQHEQWFQSYHPTVWLGYLAACLCINLGIIVVFSLVHLFLRVEIALWLLTFMLLPARLCVKDSYRKYVLRSQGCWIAVGLVSFICVALYYPLMFKPFQVMNDFMDIPEQTVLDHGQVVDNTQFINEHRIGGWYLYDPRQDNGLLRPSQDIVQTSLPNIALLKLFMTAPAHALYAYDDETHILSLKGGMDLKTYHELLEIYKFDLKAVENINLLFDKSNQIERFYKTRVYTQEEQDFITKNGMENGAKIMPGWFFFHHSWVLNPILALSLGAEQRQVFLYGWGSALFLKNAMSLLGGVSFQNYFKLIFSFYPVYFFVFLAVLYGVFRRADFVCVGAVLLSVCTMKLQYLVILLAPGYNPIRHVFDVLVFLFFFFYLKKNSWGIFTRIFLAGVFQHCMEQRFWVISGIGIDRNKYC